jgi:hypothetical protein
MKYKYIILFPIPDPYKKKIIAQMNRIELMTGVPAPHKKLVPHMSFHRPLEGISEERILALTESMVKQIRQTRIVTTNLFSFGKEYIVLPVQGTRGVAALWVGIGDLLSKLPDYKHGPYDADNTLHITIADHMTPHFDRIWPELHKKPMSSMEIPVQTVDVWKKGLEEGQKWQLVQQFELPLICF